MEKNIDRKKFERLLKPYRMTIKELQDGIFQYCLWHEISNTIISALDPEDIWLSCICIADSIDKLFCTLVSAKCLCHSFKSVYECIVYAFYGTQSLEECCIKQDMLS